MTHRVHTILSILAEDHAPVALRPSILLAVDWPIVAEEAPATGDDASAALLAALRIRGAITDNHRSIAPLAARLATVAASLTATGDKAIAHHAAALWGAAAALVGMPTAATQSPTNVDPSTAEVYLRALASKASDFFPNPGDISTAAKQATIIGTALDKTLADIHALRDILKVPEGGNLVDHADALAKNVAIETSRADNATCEYVAIAKEFTAHHAENTRLRAQVDRMIAAMREDVPAPVKPRPQPGDRVPWSEVEDGCLYFDYERLEGCPFAVCTPRGDQWMTDPDDSDLLTILSGRGGVARGTLGADYRAAILIARDLGADPEAWRSAMRQWTANGNRPAAVSTGHRPGATMPR